MEAAQLQNVSKTQFETELEQAETRITTFTRDTLTHFQESITEQKQYLEDNLSKFEKQLNDYRSQVLWRIKDCEELLKNRISGQELRDQIKALENRIRTKNIEENEAMTERHKKTYEHSEMRIKMNENLFVDRFNIIRDKIDAVQ